MVAGIRVIAPLAMRTARGIRRAIPILLNIAGLTLVSVAAGMVTVPLGILVAGLACFVLEWRVTE